MKKFKQIISEGRKAPSVDSGLPMDKLSPNPSSIAIKQFEKTGVNAEPLVNLDTVYVLDRAYRTVSDIDRSHGGGLLQCLNCSELQTDWKTLLKLEEERIQLEKVLREKIDNFLANIKEAGINQRKAYESEVRKAKKNK